MLRLECESQMTEITTLLIANRGEIARRIMRTAHEMGLRTAAVYSEPDRDAPYVLEADVAVPLSGSSATESYLDQTQILTAARKVGADAIHPGYGFLAENAAFAEACAKAGFIWIGPPPDAMQKMSLKNVAKDIARNAGVPVIPGIMISSDDATDWERAARSVGYPLLVKANAGGGGKGMRPVESATDLINAITGARREAKNAFGDAMVFLERYLPAPRHIEIQIFADMHGNVIHLDARDCSIQRRYQKVIEEAPALGILPELRERMSEAAIALARAIGYVGAGTIEYLVNGDGFYFLEMNTRLQVEHPVTECITNLDLVRLQIQVARGEPLPIRQHEVICHGHAIEARLYAEDPSAGFLPTYGHLACFEPGPTPGMRYDTGVVSGYEVIPQRRRQVGCYGMRYDTGAVSGYEVIPQRRRQVGCYGMRYDTGAVSGYEVTTHYDPLLAKVIVHAPTRTEAAYRLARALTEMRLHGLRTNRDFLAATLIHHDFLAGDTRTDFVSQHPELLRAQPTEVTRDVHVLACVAVLAHRRRLSAPVQSFVPSGWRNVRSCGQRIIFETSNGETIEIDYVFDTERLPMRFTATLGERTLQAEVLALDEESTRLVLDGIHYACRVNCVGDRVYANSANGQTELRELPRFVEPKATAIAGGPISQLPGVISAVMVTAGDHVQAGQTLVVLEAMKMEHQIVAATESVVEKVLVKVGDAVNAHQLLVVLMEDVE
jgi:propionyl-CoA carboxylase alpha chain